MQGDPRLGGEQAHGDLVAPHFEREDHARQAVGDRTCSGEVQGERGLSHRGAGRDHDHLARVEAVGEGVEVGEAGGDAGHLALAGSDGLDLVEGALHDVGERRVVLAGALFGDGVDLGLGRVDDLVDVALGGVAHAGDPGAGLDQAAQDGALVDDLRVVLGVGGGRDGVDQGVQVAGAAGPDEFTALGEFAGDGDRVGRLAAGVEVEDRAVDQLVGRAVVVVRFEDLDDVGDGVLGEQHAAEDGLFGG